MAAKTDIKDITSTFEKTNQTLQETLTNESKLQAAKNKGTLQVLYKNMSDTYESGLTQAEKTMASRGAQPTAEGFSKVIDDTLQTAKDYGVDTNDSTINVMKQVQAKLKDGEPLTLDNMIVLKNKIFSASSMGKDFVNDTFMRNYGSFIEQSVPELKALNAEYQPMLQAKSWANKSFVPYTEAEITKGANVLTKLASDKNPSQTVINYIKDLSEGRGSFKGAGDLVGGTTKAGENIKITEQMFNDAKNNLMTSSDREIFNAETDLQRINDKLASDLASENKNLQGAKRTISDLQQEKITNSQAIKSQQDTIKKIAKLKKIRDAIAITTAGAIGLGTGLGGKIIKLGTSVLNP